MPTTTYMSLALPTENASDDVWDTLLNAALTSVDSHDHSSGKGVTVKTAGISINADLSFGSNAATALKAAAFAAVTPASVTAHSRALYVSSDDFELYWRTTGGVNVKLTDGTSLNSALLGGFTGDYGSGDEEAEFTSGSGIYDFRVNDTTRAYLDTSDIRLFEATSGVTNAVKLKSPSSLSGSYTLTLPTGNPASVTRLLKTTTAGVLGYGGAATHDGDLTQTGTLTVSGATTLSTTLAVSSNATVGGTLGVTGAASLASTLGVTGLITATAGLTAAVNQHITVSGTGKFKHGGESIVIPAVDGVATAPATDAIDYGNTQGANTALSRMDVTFNGGSEKFRIPIKLPIGRRLTEVSVEFYGAGGGTKRFNVFKAAAGSAGTSIGVTSSSSTASGASGLITLGVTAHTMATGEAVWFQFDAANAGDILYHIVVGYDQP